LDVHHNDDGALPPPPPFPVLHGVDHSLRNSPPQRSAGFPANTLTLDVRWNVWLPENRGLSVISRSSETDDGDGDFRTAPSSGTHGINSL
jgi:hypothetical protein